ncbi:MAG: glyoxylate/hydroxypyruvate reductase A [Alphaproteobacteria bacterium]|nr:glyoxylate/hydroxypyruvate reductase A [Alphaproteobacteria bacterium]
MALLYLTRNHSSELWLPEILRLMPELEIHVWPNVPDPARIEFALCWGPPPGELARYPNLRGISSFGAGVEHILADPALPAVPVCRIVDERLTRGMTEYVVMSVLNHHRNLAFMRENQAMARWKWFDPVDTFATTVGIMGMGALGLHAAETFLRFGFQVAGWSRTAKELPGIAHYHGDAGLDAFLARTSYLVCLLPLTPETRGIVNRRTLGLLPRGAFFVNAGRGGQVVDEDLLAALDSGHLAGATLDVFNREPLPPDHPYWRHPRVSVTPHNASDSIPASVVPQIVENIRRARAGAPLLNVVDPARGY